MAIAFIGLVWTVDGMCYHMEFSMDAPLSGFDVSALPPEIECVEVIRIIYA